MSDIDFETTPSCMDPYDVGSTPYEQALIHILSQIKTIDGTEKLKIRDAMHRVSAEDIKAAQNIPGSRNSAMDGYACRYRELAEPDQISRLKLVGTSAAGHPFFGEIEKSACIRIFTGGVVPDELDTVIMQEDCQVENNWVYSKNTHRLGQHIRNAGEDISIGELALAKNQFIGTAELGLLASVGCSEVLVRNKPKVAFFSTGDELRAVGETLKPGDVYDSNRYTLFALLKSAHVDPIDLGVVRDDLDQTIAALTVGAQQADVVVTTAGASVGDADCIKQAIESIGELKLWKVAMKPGRPLAFGRFNDTWFFGLPGNPVSVMVTFDKFVKPALQKLRGERTPNSPLRMNVPCINPINKRRGRLEFQRGILSINDNGQAVVESTGNQSSGVLSSMSRANCYIVLPAETGNVQEGSMVTVEPFTTTI